MFMWCTLGKALWSSGALEQWVAIVLPTAPALQTLQLLPGEGTLYKALPGFG